MTDIRVVFTPSGLAGTVPEGTSVLDAARTLGVDLDTVCGGRGVCGHCQVLPTTGSFAKWSIESDASALSAPGELETDYRANRPLAPHARLGCVAVLQRDAVIDVPAASQVHRQVVRKTVALDDLVVDPVVTLAYVEMETTSPLSALRARPLGPRLGGADSRNRVPTPLAFGPGASLVGAIRLAVREQHGLEVGAVDSDALVGLHRAFGGQPRAATLALRRDPDGAAPTLAAAFAGFTDAIYGIAVDVGSTTIAGHLCDLTTGEVLGSAGRMNPQIRFGEDLMSRVSYVMMNPGGDQQLTAAVRTALDELAGELVATAAVDPAHVLDLVIVGNPIMHHLVLGIDPTPLGTAPFELATDEAVHTRACDLDVGLPNAAVYLLPCIAGHVGADTAAAMLAEGPHRSAHPQLLVDIGTNAEIVLGSVDAVFAASSPTGPAFEGAQISGGQRATVGAIERVRIDRTTLAPRLRVIGSDLWSDDPAFASEAPAVTGICGSGIVETIAELFLAGVIAADGTIRPGETSTPHVVPDGRTFAYVLFDDGETQLRVTQNDVRAIQLAKAALRAGIDLLLEHAGLETVTDIRLAGAFGAHIDPLYAMVLGLVPDCALDGIRGVGNAAGAGAVRALLSGAQRGEIEMAVRHVVKLETATEPRFQELFVAAMGFPHTTAPTPRLAELVELPERHAPVRTRRRRTIKETP